MANYCSNCGAVLDLSGDCTVCGHKHHQIMRDKHQCEYSHAGRECPATATMTKAMNGEGRWYCSAHFKHLDNKKMCDEILDDYQQNGVPRYLDWRDELINKKMNGDCDAEITNDTRAAC